MSNVKLSVGGRNYTVACADGQEDHVKRLASVIDGKLADMGANLSGQEAKNLLFAALLLADDLDEAQRALKPTPAPSPENERLGVQLERIAVALENAATTLEGGSTRA